MLRIKTTGQVFDNRKEAKEVLGHSNYNRLVKNNEVEYIVTKHDTTDIIY